MPTRIPFGSPLAEKVYATALFTKQHQAPGFMNLLSGEMPSDGSFAAKARGQTSSGFPIVKAGDLTKHAGDTIQVDLFNDLYGYPTMGDERIEGRMMGLTSSSAEIYINQFRAGADTGGRMTQKRTTHNLRQIAMASLQGFMQRYEDQTAMIHLAGARGFQDRLDWTVPLAEHPKFADIMINKVKAPTKNRKFYAGDATSDEDLGTNDALTIRDIQRVASMLRESTIPLQTIRAKGDSQVWDKPLWVMFVSERQWFYLRSRESQKDWQELVAQSVKRKSKGVKHPLFDYVEDICVDGIIVRPLANYAIRFPQGSPVVVDTGGTDGKTYTESTLETAVDVDRAILVGAQALAKVYGRSQSNYFYSWSEEKVDHGNSIEIVPGSISGTAKLTFKIDGVDTDLGVVAIDSYAPAMNTAEGVTLMNN
jgi:N4-gp56 family major capsid protein